MFRHGVVTVATLQQFLERKMVEVGSHSVYLRTAGFAQRL
jgi:hypothetical protein